MRTRKDLNEKELAEVQALIREALDAAEALWAIPFGENRVHEIKSALVKRLVKEFGLSEEEIEKDIDLASAFAAPITLDVLKVFSDIFPAEYTTTDLEVYKDAGEASFGTFRITLDDIHARTRPKFVQLFVRNIQVNVAAETGERVRPYVGVLVRVPNEKLVVAIPVCHGSALSKPIGYIGLPEKKSGENINVLILFELAYPGQLLAIAREVQDSEKHTLLVIAANPYSKEIANN